MVQFITQVGMYQQMQRTLAGIPDQLASRDINGMSVQTPAQMYQETRASLINILPETHSRIEFVMPEPKPLMSFDPPKFVMPEPKPLICLEPREQPIYFEKPKIKSWIDFEKKDDNFILDNSLRPKDIF